MKGVARWRSGWCRWAAFSRVRIGRARLLLSGHLGSAQAGFITGHGGLQRGQGGGDLRRCHDAGGPGVLPMISICRPCGSSGDEVRRSV